MSSAPPYGSWLPPAAEPPGGPPPPGESPSGAEDTPRQGLWSAALALAFAFACAIFGAIVVGIVGAAFGASFERPPPAVNVVATFVQDVAFVGTALLFARRAGAAVGARLGFVRTRPGLALRWMAIAYLGYVVLSQIWAQLVHTHAKDNLPTSLGVDESAAALVAVCVLVTVIAPLAEETFFRGYFFGALRNWRGPWPAALLTGAVFGAIHYGSAPAVYLLPLAIFGVALCVVRWQTGSLLPCVALHALNNALAFGVAESWTAGQTLALGVGAVGVTMLACRAAIAAAPRWA